MSDNRYVDFYKWPAWKKQTDKCKNLVNPDGYPVPLAIEIEKRIQQKQEELAELRLELKHNCPHPVYYQRISIWNSAGYGEDDSWVEDIYCDLCHNHLGKVD